MLRRIDIRYFLHISFEILFLTFLNSKNLVNYFAIVTHCHLAAQYHLDNRLPLYFSESLVSNQHLHDLDTYDMYNTKEDCQIQLSLLIVFNKLSRLFIQKIHPYAFYIFVRKIKNDLNSVVLDLVLLGGFIYGCWLTYSRSNGVLHTKRFDGKSCSETHTKDLKVFPN